MPLPMLESGLRNLTKKMLYVRGGWRLIEPIRRHYVRQYEQRDDSSLVIQDYDGDLRFRLDRASYMGSLIYWRGYHSFTELCCLNRLLTPEMVFADVGANRGEFTIYAAKRLTRGTVLSFEPLADNFAVLKENVSLNGFDNARVFACGLADVEEQREIFTSADHDLHGSWHEGLATLYQTDYRGRPLGTVTLRRFDDVFNEQKLSRLDGMKIDVEGAEMAVLKGAMESIAKHRPFILMEMNQETFHAAGYSKEDIANRLQPLGYQCFHIGRRGALTETSCDNLPDFCNALWVAKS